MKVRVMKLKNEKGAGKNEDTEEIIKGGSDMGVDRIWRMCRWFYIFKFFLLRSPND